MAVVAGSNIATAQVVRQPLIQLNLATQMTRSRYDLRFETLTKNSTDTAMMSSLRAERGCLQSDQQSHELQHLAQSVIRLIRSSSSRMLSNDAEKNIIDMHE